MTTILTYLIHMAPYMGIGLLIFLLTRLAVVPRRKRAGQPTAPWHEIGAALFVMFLAGLASQTILPRLDFIDGGLSFGGIIGMHREYINLIPLRVVKETIQEVRRGNFDYLLINGIGNVVMFFPIGFCLPLLWRGWTGGKTIAAAFGCSLLIELCQLPLARGTDVDDLLLNTLGGAAGYLLYWCAARWTPRFTALFWNRRPAAQGEGTDS